jgi:hypothetical protein
VKNKNKDIGFEVLIEVTVKRAVLWVITPCGSEEYITFIFML